MKKLAYCSRDNARTPVQWDDTQNAGFTTGEPWLKVAPSYREINAKQAENDGNSVLHYYKKLIKLRKNDKAFVYGKYRDLMPKSKTLLVYLRESEYGTLLVVNNFANKRVKFALPKSSDGKEYKLVTSNYTDSPAKPQTTVLRPYESIIYKADSRTKQ